MRRWRWKYPFLVRRNERHLRHAHSWLTNPNPNKSARGGVLPRVLHGTAPTCSMTAFNTGGGVILDRTYGNTKKLPGTHFAIFTGNSWCYLLWSPRKDGHISRHAQPKGTGGVRVVLLNSK